MPGFPPGVHLIGGRNAAATHAQAARKFYAPIIPVVVELRRQGLSLRAIAAELDRRGVEPPGEFKDRHGFFDDREIAPRCFQRWSATAVRRVLARAAAEDRPATP